MTVCLGAICADQSGKPNSAVVVASDRMVNLGGFTEFEHEVPKLMCITSRIVGLLSGDALHGSQLVREVTLLAQNAHSVQDIANITAMKYADFRRMQIEREIFTPRGITMQQFYTQGLQQSMLPQLVTQMDNHIGGFNFGVELLIAGVDDAGGHLLSVGNPGGIVNDFHPIGHTAIGSGAYHAAQSMIGFGHMGARELNETIFTVYASKRRAEVAPGVGRDTDLVVITESGTVKLLGEQLQQLESLYAEYQSPLTTLLKDKTAKLATVLEANTNNGKK